ncbi:MAG: DUF494 domain-containing protein [Pseudomonadota bacterium]|nr:DUF494 domain-containing protein [Pseudomonadota bacterium]
MKEELFEVLMYLFENHIRHGEGKRVTQESLYVELSEEGFNPETIDMAFAWLDGFAGLQITEGLDEDKLEISTGFRVFSTEEYYHLGSDICSLLYKLEVLNVLNPVTREQIINRLLSMDTSELETQQVKWLVLMVLLDEPDSETALSTLENLMRAEITGRHH